MKKEGNFQNILKLFVTFMKIGAFTFGGGYAMIPIIQSEVVDKRKWVGEVEILDILAISESTPGPIAINSATYIGYKVAGFWGSFFATLGIVTPSFLIIYIISLFYKDFMSWKPIQYAFKGLKVGVIILLLRAVLKLKKSIKLSPSAIIVFVITFIGMTLTTIFSWQINIGSFNLSISLLFILFGLIYGVMSVALSKGGKDK